MNSPAKNVLFFALIGLMLSGALVAVFEIAHPFAKYGTVSVYFAYGSPTVYYQVDQSTLQAPPADRLTVQSLTVTVDSVQVHSGISNDTGWTTISNSSVTLNLMNPSGDKVLLGSTNIAEQNITMVRMHVASAAATVQYSNGTTAPREVKVPSDVLKVPLMAEVRGQLTTSITLTPGGVHVVQNDPLIVRPVILLKDVDGPK